MILAALIMATLALLALGQWARLRVRDLNVAAELQADFFHAANKLVDDDGVPDEAVEFLAVIARLIGDRRAPWRLLRLLLAGAIRQRAQGAGKMAHTPAHSVQALDAAQGEQFARALVTGSLAVSYNSVVAGRLLRRLAMYRIFRSGRSHHDGADDAGALMSGLATT